MPDPSPVHPLAAHLDDHSPARRDAGVRISFPVHSGLWQVLAFQGNSGIVEQALRNLHSGRPEIVIRQTAPDDWLALSHGIGQPDLAAALGRALGNAAALADQSDAKVVFCAEGKDVRALLSKGTAVELHPDRFPEGKSVATMFNHFAVQLTRTGNETFEIIVTRSFSAGLFEELMACGREFGIGLAADPAI